MIRIRTKLIENKDFLFVFYIIFAGISIILSPSAFGQPFQQQPFQQQPFQQQPFQQQQPSFLSNTYTDPQGRFTLNYPSDWFHTATSISIIDKYALNLMSPNGVSLFEVNIPMPSYTSNADSASILNSFIEGAKGKMQNPIVLQSIECNKYTLSGEK